MYCKSCNNIAFFNFKNQKPAYCFKHKLHKMRNVSNDMCIFENCLTKSYYNFKGEKRGIYCARHKLFEMVNVVDKCCKYDGCNMRPLYNFAHEVDGEYCYKHKVNNMVNVQRNRKYIYKINFDTTYKIKIENLLN